MKRRVVCLDIKARLNAGFRDLQGGLFAGGTADYYGSLVKQGVDIMARADPFMPDPSIPESVQNAMIGAIREGLPSHYPPLVGRFDLRYALAEKVREKTGLDIDPDRNILITSGSDAGLFYTMMTMINPGDEVLVPEPSYPSNFVDPGLLGGVAVSVPLYEEDNYQIRIEELDRRVTEKTKLIVITQPNNPTTTVYRRENLEQLCAFIIKNDLLLISDQAFEDHIFDGIEFVAPASLPGMRERTITVCSISKGYGLSGFRIGYIYADDRIMDVLYGGVGNVLGTAATITSIGAVAAVRDQEYLADVYRRLELRRRIAYDILSTIPGVKMKMPESGILSWVNISALGTSDAVRDYLLKEAKILVGSGNHYGSQGEGYLRIVSACFNDDEVAIGAFDRIKTALTKLAEQKGIV